MRQIASGARIGEEPLLGGTWIVAMCVTSKTRRPAGSSVVVTCPTCKSEGQRHHA
jgi:hypothetical protein